MRIARLAFAVALAAVIVHGNAPQPTGDFANVNAFRYYCQAQAAPRLADARAQMARAADIAHLEGWGAEGDRIAAVSSALDDLAASFGGGDTARAAGDVRRAQTALPRCPAGEPAPLAPGDF